MAGRARRLSKQSAGGQAPKVYQGFSAVELGGSEPLDIDPPPFRIQTLMESEGSPESFQTQPKSTFKLHRERMEASEFLVGSSMSSASKDFIGTTSPKIWSRDDDAFDIKAKYRHQVELRKEELGELAKPRRRRSTGGGIQDDTISTENKRLAATVRKLTVAPLQKKKTQAPADPAGTKPPPTARKQVLASPTARKMTAAPPTARKTTAIPATGRKMTAASPAARKVVVAPPTSRKPNPLSSRKVLTTTDAADKKILLVGHEKKKKPSAASMKILAEFEASALEDGKKPTTANPPSKGKAKQESARSLTRMGDSGELDETVSFAAVLQRSRIPPLRRSSMMLGGGIGRKPVSGAMGVQDLSIVQGYAHLASDGTRYQTNSFAKPRDMRRSSGDMSKGLPERFIVDVNMHGFEDDEIFFQTDDASLVITGLRPKREGLNARKVTEVIEFPEGVYPEALRIARGSSGLLTIEQC